jgi:hypothetical protein
MSLPSDIFREVFLSSGYREERELPIFPAPDKTTLFTCATISTLKKYILTNSQDKVFVVQHCLRTQNLKYSLDKDFDPEYLSSFLMFGSLCPIERFDPRCINDFFGFFPNLKEKVLVRTSKIITDDIFSFVENNYKTEYESRSPSYYKWKYGDASLSGKGITFAIRQPAGHFLDVGNLVVMYKCGRAIAVEFGFGEETFLSRQDGLESPYSVSQIYLGLGLGMSPAEKRLGDTLIIALRLFENGVVHGTGKESSILRKALRNICFLSIGMYGQSAITKVYELAKNVSLDLAWFNLIEQTMTEVQAAIAAFTHEVEHMRNHTDDQGLQKKIRDYQARYGIPEQFHP